MISDARDMGVQGAEELGRQRGILMGVKDKVNSMNMDLRYPNNESDSNKNRLYFYIY